MERLISMTDFVLEQVKRKVSVISHMICIEDYANFLKQKLELYMFVPCKFIDGVWVVLEDPPKNVDENNLDWQIEYQEAKDRVLFEGFEKDNSFVTHGNHSSFFYPISCLHEQTIEDLVKYNLELTQTAKKQIGL